MASYNRGYKRVRDKPWRAIVRIDGERKFLGSFHTREQAEKVEQAAREKKDDASMPKKS